MLRSRVWGDCGFMAKVVDPDDSQVEVPLAHADMADIVEDALRFASPDQKVGASGVMECNAEGKYAGKIFWRVISPDEGTFAANHPILFIVVTDRQADGFSV
ncbi:hypothetical protein CIB48_g2595 [Xylaria polymorpha]|nr:hypothetical protein CIB48_g2595 [Xylaria polymorpha]